MKAEIICIGTELLLGQVVDTNASFVARELANLGIDLYHKTTVGDNLERIDASLKLAWERADLLIISGGLGPTQDDLTREGIADLIGEELEFKPEAWEEVCSHFRKIQRPISDNNRRQAFFPPSGQIIPNHFGTAPAVYVAKEGHYVIALPGVPSELKGIWAQEVQPLLRTLLQSEGSPVLTSRTIRMIGIGESAMEEQVMDLILHQTNPTVAPYAGRGESSLRVTAKGFNEIENLRQVEKMADQIRERLQTYIYGYDSDNLETVVGRQLKMRQWRLATAESCTGGLVAHRITNVAGSSDYFWGGVNCYSNQVKMNLLGVPEQILAQFGAVSPETAKSMAERVRQHLAVDVGLAITGIAGPDGGSSEKPVGLVYLAIALPNETIIEKRLFGTDRIGNKESAAQAALALLWRTLNQETNRRK